MTMVWDRDLYKYHCSKCDLGFKVKTNYDKHCKTHRKIYACKDCSAKFNNFRNYKRHLHMHSGVIRYECSLCNANFSKKEIVERHLSISHQIYKIECQICGKGLSSRNDALVHLRTLHSKIDFSGCTIFNDKKKIVKLHFPCKSCSEIFLTKLELNDHTKQKHSLSTNSYSLRKLGKSIKIKKSLVNELAKKITNRNKKPRAFECRKCKKKFKNNFQLAQHNLIHEPIGDVRTNNKRQRNGSNQKNGGAETKKKKPEPKLKTEPVKKLKSTSIPTNVIKLNRRRCPTCKKQFSSNYSLNRHLKIHTNQKTNNQRTNKLVERKTKQVKKNNFTLVITPLKSPGTVKSKMKNVAPLRTPSFEIYPRVFDIVGQTPNKKTKANQKSSPAEKEVGLEDIIKENPFQCKICKLRFVRREEMVSHVESKHFNKCTYCNRTFSEKKYLQSHMRGAHAEKMFICTKCDKMFVQSFHLDQHVKLVHNKSTSVSKSAKTMNFQCSTCGRILSSAAVLKRHRINVHKESV